MTSFIVFIGLFLLGLIFGRINESRHFARIAREEQSLSHIKVFNLKQLPEGLAPDAALVSGNTVVAVDYFKKIVAGLKTLIGGRLRSYESLLERARREAIIRLQKEADLMGATAIYNVRLEFSTTGNQPVNAFGGVEIFAFGTAVKEMDRAALTIE